MVVQHFSPVGFSRASWPAQARKIMGDLNLDSKKLSELVYTNPSIELGEVYLGYQRAKKKWKLIYILPKHIWDGDNKIWATFVRFFPPKSPHNSSNSWLVGGSPTKMSLDGDALERGMSRRIARSYPEYISLTQLKELLKPIQFMNWMWERPISPKEDKITKEEPEEEDAGFEGLDSLFG